MREQEGEEQGEGEGEGEEKGVGSNKTFLSIAINEAFFLHVHMNNQMVKWNLGKCLLKK